MFEKFKISGLLRILKSHSYHNEYREIKKDIRSLVDVGEPAILPLIAVMNQQNDFMTSHVSNALGRLGSVTVLTKTSEGKTIIYPEGSLILSGPGGRVIWSAIK
jgi:hypothetical protein